MKDAAAAENLGVVWRVAASLLRQDHSKGSTGKKSTGAAWEDEFRLHL